MAAEAVFVIAVSFLAGVFFASAGWNLYIALIFASAASAAVLFSKRSRLLALLLLGSIFSGFFYFHLILNLRRAEINIVFGRETAFSGIVASQPRKLEKVQILELELLPPESGKIEAMLSLEKEIKYGDQIEFSGVVEPPAEKREKPIAFFPETKLVARRRGSWLKHELLELKEGFISQFQRFLPADSAAFISGLTLGARSDFSSGLKEAMRKSGTTHLTALSGYNISILVLAVAKILGSRLPRRWTFIFSAVFILLFVIMTGGEASIVRAGLMGFLALLAKESGRIYSPRNAVALTALGMTLFEPTLLAYDAGFQLSFLSLLGITYFAPALTSALKINRKNSGILNWKENLLTTVSAQAAVLPVLLHYFREFSVFAVVANTLILGFIPYTMFLGFALAGLGFFSHYLGLALSWLVNALLVYEIWVIKLFAKIYLPVGAGAGPIFILTYYALIAAFIFRQGSKNVRQIA